MLYRNVLWGCLIGIGLGASWAKAQVTVAPGYVHEQWTVVDGLPVNVVSDLLQASDGYLWMSTYDGLVRFDGVQFTVYNASNSPGLPSNRLHHLIETSPRSLWMIAEQQQLIRFDRETHTFLAFPAAQVIPTPGNYMLIASGFGEQRSHWLLLEKGIARIHRDTLIFVAPDRLQEPFTTIHQDRTETVWLGTQDGRIVRWRDGTRTEFSVANAPIRALYETAGTLWIGTDAGVYRGTGEAMQPVAVAPAIQADVFFEDTEHRLWLGSRSGWFYLDGDRFAYGYPGSSKRQPAHPQRGAEGRWWTSVKDTLFHDGQAVLTIGPASRKVQKMMLDHEGSAWFSTNGHGLHRVRPSLLATMGPPEGDHWLNVYSVVEDRQGTLWLGTQGSGVNYIAHGQVQRYPNVTVDVVKGIGLDQAKRVWVGTDPPCVIEEAGCIPVAAPPQMKRFHAMYQDQQGRYWFGDGQGVFRYDGVSWTQVATRQDLRQYTARVFYETREGVLWMGTSGRGLVRYTDADGLRFFTTADGLSSNFIRAIYEDEDGFLWVGTQNLGLNRIDFREGDEVARVSHYLRRDGLFDNVIHQILEDEAGRFWMSTNRGIFWVERQMLNAFAEGTVDRLVSTGYTERDGMLNREGNGGWQNAGIRTRDGRLAFATQNGVVFVDPTRLHTNETPPLVAIEEVVVEGVAQPPIQGTVRLAKSQRDFEIAYTALSFLEPNNVRFRYRLDGFNARWVDIGRRTAYFTNVPPGDYVFQVQASNNAGVWSEAPATLSLRIAPYFYETGWFLALAGFSLFLLGFGGYRYRIRHLKRRGQELETLVAARTATIAQQTNQLKALDEAKSRFFANISHEFRTPLTLTLGPLEDLQDGLFGTLDADTREQVDLAHRNARRLLRLINQLLDLSRLESGAITLHRQPVDLGALLQSIAEPFAALAARKQIDFRLNRPQASVMLDADADRLDEVFVNLIGNAFKFTPAGGTITVTLVPAEETTTVTIADTGVGIASEELPHIFERFYQGTRGQQSARPGTGLGLALSRELVVLHGGTVAVESAPGVGSQFVVMLPGLGDGASGSRGTGETERVERIGEVAETRNMNGTTEAAQAASLQSERRKHDARSTDQTTVLVVDDHPDIRAYVRRHLEPHYRVLEAADGAEGLAQIRAHLPDLVISDVMMPELDGYDLCRALRSDPALAFLPLILLTGRAAAEDKLAGLSEGADDYLTKPFDVRELRVRVDNLIAQRQRLRAALGVAPPKPHRADPASPTADAFLDEVRGVVLASLGDETLDVERVAAALGMSRSQLYRRVKAASDGSPTHLIRQVRLAEAARLLREEAGNVSEVAYAVGFNSIAHFSRSFRKAYGVAPSAYATARAVQERR